MNCLDRHVEAGHGKKVAYYFEGEPGDRADVSPTPISSRRSKKFANVLKGLGVKKGDRVTLYMGMVPELPIAMLACARIGAAHSVVFGGFSPDALRERINDSKSKVAGHHGRRAGGAGKSVPLKHNADEALKDTPTLEKVVVVRARRRAGRQGHHEGRPRLLVARPDGQGLRRTAPPEPMDAEDLLFILYTSGTTGKPKGIVAHHRRLHGRRGDHHEVGLRHQAGGRLLVHRRHRVGHRAQLHRVRPARSTARPA